MCSRSEAGSGDGVSVGVDVEEIRRAPYLFTGISRTYRISTSPFSLALHVWLPSSEGGRLDGLAARHTLSSRVRCSIPLKLAVEQ